MKIFHFSYHKCLTVYYGTVMGKLFNDFAPRVPGGYKGYKHFNSLKEEFLANTDNYSALSVNNHAIELDILPDCRATQFIRDPRDLTVSGYFYHKRGTESWTRIVGPSFEEWEVVNGCLPKDMPSGLSFSRYLETLSVEDGLIAEIDFRRRHFESMERWNHDKENLLVVKYEDIVGNEVVAFDRICKFYKLPFYLTWKVRKLADKYAVARQKEHGHIRDPKPNQWRVLFTDKVKCYFKERHPDILQKLGYEKDSEW